MDYKILDDTVELITRQMLKDVFVDGKKDELVTMKKSDLYKLCIKLVKLIQQIEKGVEKYD